MTNSYGTGLLGLLGQTEQERRKSIAWSKAIPMENSFDRIDCDGRIICWAEYGKKTARGWEIDHATPTALGGADVYGNLRARHWEGNSRAGGILSGLSCKPATSAGLLGGLFPSR
jgi:hypothetical protein